MLLGSLLAALALGFFSEARTAASSHRDEDERRTQKAIAEIEALGGKALQDETDPAKPIILVDLSSTGAGDADLKLLSHFTQLKGLALARTRITDHGLKSLQGLTNLR